MDTLKRCVWVVASSRLSPELRVIVGIMTIALFTFVGGALWSADAKLPAVLVLAMAAYRGFFVARGLWWWLGPDDEEDEEPTG